MFDKLRGEVLRANLEIARLALAFGTWGNASGVDRKAGIVVIKPSGIAYDQLAPDAFVAVNLQGEVVEGALRPSSDTPIHLELYRGFLQVGGIAHSHSTYASAWAQTCRDLPCLGTTHGDHFHGPIPCTPPLTEKAVRGDYERETGKSIVETFRRRDIDPLDVPGVFCANHGPFAFGRTAEEAVYHAAVLEQVVRMAWITLQISPGSKPIPDFLLEKHYRRKHGPKAYYGQERE